MEEVVRLGVQKTRKLYIGGSFNRSESGRSRPVYQAGGKKFLANVCLASRKDLRDAVQAARKALTAWRAKTAYNRGQILYRMAEMMESRRSELETELAQATGMKENEAREETSMAIDRVIYYAGWCDKIVQVVGNANPVAAPYFNFTIPEPVGVVGVVCPNENPLLSFISLVIPIVAGGNSTVCLASEKYPTVAVCLAEIFATSDLPGGVINILTGNRSELLGPMASHMDVNALALAGISLEEEKEAQMAAAENVKRVRVYRENKSTPWTSLAWENIDVIADYMELKTVWHPIGS
ncbi:MAG: aldehyde dehydrogenase family protein [Leptospiraceae bacterium]|nr:aldehyde dehydrogenase family protein [Leptospiraceae bacterium]MDW8305996.1 aldehyde dehydrogenase family protein [Leptospiraceae bacterium]